MIPHLAREFFGPCADALHLWHARDRGDYVGNRDRCETMTLEETSRAGAEQIEMPRPTRVRGLARRREERAADSTPAHRFVHVQRAYKRRVDLGLDANHADRVVAEIPDDVTRGRPLDSLGRHAAALEHRAHQCEVARLLDDEFARAMLAYRHALEFASYFFGGGKSCTPASSTTVIALTGHDRAAETITPSPAPVALTTSDLPSSSS